MEATGPYSLPLADFLAAQGYPDSAVNPAKTHAFANTLWGTRSEPGRTKTDKAAAKLIARYALRQCNRVLDAATARNAPIASVNAPSRTFTGNPANGA